MKTKQYNQKQGTLKHYKNENKEHQNITRMKTKQYNQKQRTLQHYKNENKTIQSKTKNTTTLQE
jgi:hypothetical protein